MRRPRGPRVGPPGIRGRVRPGAGTVVGPRTSAVQDGRYLTDVAQADSDLATYVQHDGDVALKAMLTDGSAFCAFLRRGGGPTAP